MFRKIIALSLSVIISCSLAACGGTSSSGGQTVSSESAASENKGSEASDQDTQTEASDSSVTEDSADGTGSAQSDSDSAAMEASADGTGSAQSDSDSAEGSASSQETAADSALAGTGSQAQETASETSTSSKYAQELSVTLGQVANTLAEDEEALISNYADRFEQLTYTDAETGLSITYNLFLPAEYDESGAYPMVVFIADSSCANGDATASLTQGRGALVWATDEWQSVYPTIVAVPTYPETILDDHGSYTTTEYVELTKRFIDYMGSEYAVDTSRIYGTGQSMGCMTTLILASEYPDLYRACMFVDGQWDYNTLSALEDQSFIYFAAEDDTNAWNGALDLMAVMDADGVSYKYAQWDGTWSADELSAAAQKLFNGKKERLFVSWAPGTIDASSVSMGGSGAPGGFGGPGGSSDSAGGDATSGGPGSAGGGSASGGPAGAPGGGPDSAGGDATSSGPDSAPGGANSSSYHMASFDYAYNCVAVMEWLIQQ